MSADAEAPHRPIWSIVAVTTIVSVFAGVPTLTYPMGRDQGNYAAAGWVWREGGVLYRDVLTFKPPATAWLHGLSQMLFGTNPVAVRAWDVLWTSATVGALTWLAWRLFRRRDVALVTAVAYCLAYWRISYWHIAQTDGWLNLAAIVAVGLVIVAGDAWGAGRRPLAWLGFVAAGAASAFAVLFKYTGAFVALPMLVAFVLVAHTYGRSVWWGLLGVVAGGAGTLGLVGLGLWAQGAGEIFLRTHTELIAGYVGEADKSWADRLWGLFRPVTRTNRNLFYLVASGWLSLPFAVAALWRVEDRLRVAGALVLVWWVGAQLGVMAQGRFFAYHYHPTGIPNVLLLGIASTWLLDRVPAGLVQRVTQPRWVPLAATVMLCGLVYYARPIGYRGMWSIASGEETLEEHYGRNRFKAYGWPISDQAELSAWLRESTVPDERVFVWGFDPVIHVWSERRPASRLIYNFPLALRTSDHDFWLDVLLRDLERADPPVFVIATGDALPMVTGFEGDSRDLFLSYPKLVAYVLHNYEMPQSIGAYEVWTRRWEVP